MAEQHFERKKQHFERQMQRPETTVDSIGEDVLRDILSRLPASSCGSAASVSRFWNAVANRILSVPKLCSAVSFKPNLQDAVNEVVDEVLSQPIRPQFAIASISPEFKLAEANTLISKRFGSEIPVIVGKAQGIMGRDALTNEFKEVIWDLDDDDDDDNSAEGVNVLRSGTHHGVLLTVGFFPGLKVKLITLFASDSEYRGFLVDEFVINIKQYSSLVSGTDSPQGIIMFSCLDAGMDAETAAEMEAALVKIDYAFPKETVIVGDGGGMNLYQDDDYTDRLVRDSDHAAVLALVFAKDKDKQPGVGETQFHLMFSGGLSSCGPTYKTVCVKQRPIDGYLCTWITAKREGHKENLDGETLLEHISQEVGDQYIRRVLYIGVTKRRKYSIFYIERKTVEWITSKELFEVVSGDEEYLCLNGIGIKTGDSFRFYIADPNAALASCKEITEKLKHLKDEYGHRNHMMSADKKGIFGGIAFSCCGRGRQFFGQANVDSSPFLENFPEVPLAGTICSGEIARMDSNPYGEGPEEHSNLSCCSHAFSTVYLVFSYTPAGP